METIAAINASSIYTFESYWDQIHFGTAVQGAVWEVRAPNAPQRISLSDSYLTVDFGHWHSHLCIGDYRGSRHHPASAELAQHRRTWGLRLFNGQDKQQMMVFLPNPYLTVEQKVLKELRWEQLAMWDHLRQIYLGLEPDPLDREASWRMCGG